MSLTILQSGATLQSLSQTGVLTTLALPTNVTLRTDVPPRWAVYGRNVILVNTPSQPLSIDATGTVRLLCPKPPRLAPILAGVNGGALSGTYTARMTFVTQDVFGNVLSESDFSPTSNAVTIATQFLGASNLDISPDQITGRRLYRTTTNGAVYFQWVDLDGNIITSVQDDLSDAGLSLFAAPTLGTPPRLTTIAEFRGRLFGCGDIDIDDLRYTEAGFQYAWPELNTIPIPSIGSDAFGITGLIPRREALGVGRRNMLVQITGSGAEVNGQIDLNPIIISKELGIESQETVQVYRDNAYFLWKDGVYRWNSDGLTCISDGTPTTAGYTGPVSGKGNVRSWFATDSYFNRSLFNQAFAHIDPNRPVYRLFLYSAGSTTIDSWVEYDINDGLWWGPHKTGAFTPVSAFHRTTAADVTVPLIGSATNVYQEQATRTDDTNVAITFDTVGKRHDEGEPDYEKYFGEITLLTTTESGGQLTVQSRVGDVNQQIAQTQYHDLTKPRERMGRLGQGKHAQIELINAQVGQAVEVLGYEVDPVDIVGRR